MGWSGGTTIFDRVVAEILEKDIHDDQKTAIIETLLDALQDADWDTESESDHFEEPLVRAIFERKFPEWFEDTD